MPRLRRVWRVCGMVAGVECSLRRCAVCVRLLSKRVRVCWRERRMRRLRRCLLHRLLPLLLLLLLLPLPRLLRHGWRPRVLLLLWIAISVLRGHACGAWCDALLRAVCAGSVRRRLRYHRGTGRERRKLGRVERRHDRNSNTLSRLSQNVRPSTWKSEQCMSETTGGESRNACGAVTTPPPCVRARPLSLQSVNHGADTVLGRVCACAPSAIRHLCVCSQCSTSP